MRKAEIASMLGMPSQDPNWELVLTEKRVPVIKPPSKTGRLSKHAKTREKVLRGIADANVDFGDLCSMLTHYGFKERIKGSHHIFTKDGIPEIVNLQPNHGKAKAYQVKQVRGILAKMDL